MAASNAKAPVVTLVLFCGVAAATLLWQHLARTPEPTSAPTSTPAPASGSASVPPPVAVPSPQPAPAPAAPIKPVEAPAPAAPPPSKKAEAPPAPPVPVAPAPAAPQPDAAAPPAAPATSEGHASAASGASSFGTPPASPAPPAPEAAAADVPHFDVVRVEPSGEAVVAGKAAPQSEVQLLASGKVVASGTTDAVGNFVLIPPRLDPGSYDLTLRVTPPGKAPRDSQQSVAVAVPPRSGGQVVVALSEPGRPTQLLSAPPTSKPPVEPAEQASPASPPAPSTAAKTSVEPGKAPEPGKASNPEVASQPEAPAPADAAPRQPELAIRSVELENGNGVIASGVAVPGSRIQLYLNDTPLASVQAAPDGSWSLTVKKGLTAGHYTVRADASADGKTVVLRAEVPFDVPVAMAETKAETKPEPKTAAAKPGAGGSEVTKSEAAPSGTATSQAAPPQAAPPKVTTSEPPKGAEPKTTVPSPAGQGPDVAAEAAKAGPAPAAPPAAPAAGGVTPSERAATLAAPATVPHVANTTAPDTTAPGAPSPAGGATLSKSAPVAAPSSPARTAATTPEPSSSHAVIEQVDTATVIRGDNLWRISRHRYGLGRRYTQIYAANTDQIRNPRLIYPGQVLVIPPK